MFKKHFRIVRNNLSKEAEKSYHPLRYRIEERYTIFFFIHWWSTPTFAPPHNHETYTDAYQYIKDMCSDAIISSNIFYER
jgi:hypothetical protein